MAKVTRIDWTREHMLIALNIYEKLPFGKFDKGNRLIIDIAGRMGRSPSSLAMKLSNFASMDPVHKARGVKGLPKTTALDRSMWAEFRTNHDELAILGEELFSDMFSGNGSLAVVDGQKARIIQEPTGGLEKYLPKKVRYGQRYFRQIVLNAYGGRCGVTGLALRQLLVASHIIPWSEGPSHRLDPQNGIALNSLHDKAFDRGLITFDADLRLVCGPSLRDYFTNIIVSQSFQALEGQALNPPTEGTGPRAEFLDWHRENIFRKG